MMKIKEFTYKAFVVALDVTIWVIASRGGVGRMWMVERGTTRRQRRLLLVG